MLRLLVQIETDGDEPYMAWRHMELDDQALLVLSTAVNEINRVGHKWINIKSSLPDNEREVIVTVDIGGEREVTTGRYFKNGATWKLCGACTDCVTHWMELPRMAEVSR